MLGVYCMYKPILGHMRAFIGVIILYIMSELFILTNQIPDT
jgi:hypothetical protein